MLGEGFQLDSSLSYHSGDNEGIEGDLDVVIPLWNGGRHAVFAQPGAVFWTGLAEEERIDGNIGLVYRAELVRDLVAGASVFYDHDFHVGHSRVSGGIDLQSGFFRFGANYYHVLSEIEDGREGFVEEAVDGMDARLVFEREVVRLGSAIGYWDYEGEENSGEEDSRSGWKTSIGLDAGVRIFPGVFAEASWERHKDDIVLDERIFAGLAFRFSLPDFEGASYGDGSMPANLHKIVDREKRILYEERVAGPTVSVVLPDGVSDGVKEGGMVSVNIQLSEALNEDVTINLVGSGTAEYGSSNDYTVSVGGTTCTGVTEDDCRVTIAMGETSAALQVSINEDGGGESPETIILSTAIALAGNTDLMPGGSLVLTIPADPPLPTVSLSADATSITEGNTATITLTLSGDLGSDATFNLIGVGGSADVTYGASNDWNLSVGGTDCDMASGTSCQVTINASQRTAEVIVEVNTDTIDETSPETFIVSVAVDSGSLTIVQPGSRSSLNFTIPADFPNVSFNYSGSTSVSDLSTPRMSLSLSQPLDDPVKLNIVGDGSTATYGTGGGWLIAYNIIPADSSAPVSFDGVGATTCLSLGSGCQLTIPARATLVDIRLSILTDSGNIVMSVHIPQESESLVKLGNTSSVMITAVP